MRGCPAVSIKEVTKSVCVRVVIKRPVQPCASYLLFLDEVMYLRMALGTSIVSSFTSTMSKEFTYDSFLSPTCEAQHRQLGPTFYNLRCCYKEPQVKTVWPGHWGSRWWGCSGAQTPRQPWSGLLKSPPAAARWADPAALWGQLHVTEHLPSCWRSGSVGLWRLAGPP